ncbi:hypothetical protein M2138_001533 [Dysgonomonadaceae bacterium PH5-43]|nr:hypothetical protein [Dysgonomonadaceae bacterium PH5-43]
MKSFLSIIIIVVSLMGLGAYPVLNDKSLEINQFLEQPKESIDTLEFIAFWNTFRTALLERDTVSLASILDNGFTMCSPDFLNMETMPSDSHYRQKYMSTVAFTRSIDKLLSHPYELLLKSLDVEKDLAPRKITFDPASWGRRYKNYIYIDDRYYFSTIYKEKDTWIYIMGYNIHPEYESFMAYEFRFEKINNKIKLKVIECTYHSFT